MKYFTRVKMSTTDFSQLVNNAITYLNNDEIRLVLEKNPKTRDEIINIAFDEKCYTVLHYMSTLLPELKKKAAVLSNPQFLRDLVKYKPNLPKLVQTQYSKGHCDMITDLLLVGVVDFAEEYMLDNSHDLLDLLTELLKLGAPEASLVCVAREIDNLRDSHRKITSFLKYNLPESVFRLLFLESRRYKIRNLLPMIAKIHDIKILDNLEANFKSIGYDDIDIRGCYNLAIERYDCILHEELEKRAVTSMYQYDSDDSLS